MAAKTGIVVATAAIAASLYQCHDAALPSQNCATVAATIDAPANVPTAPSLCPSLRAIRAPAPADAMDSPSIRGTTAATGSGNRPETSRAARHW
jgi:hypothetical protein